MKVKWILSTCIIGLIVFAGLMVAEFVVISKAVEMTMQTVKVAIENDTLLQRLKRENIRLASADIADQIVAKLPDDIHFRLLAIGPISGESQGLTDTLTSKIKAQTRYHIIERKDLNRLLEEQGIQLSPIADTRQPVEPGRIKGVEGLILGRLEVKQASFAWCSLEAFIKLDNVEGGDVVFADTFYARHVPKHTTYGAVAIIFLILLIFCANSLKKRKIKKVARVVESDSDTLVGLQDELHKAKDLVNQAHDRLVQPQHDAAERGGSQGPGRPGLSVGPAGPDTVGVP
jgi:hypothetical protein